MTQQGSKRCKYKFNVLTGVLTNASMLDLISYRARIGLFCYGNQKRRCRRQKTKYRRSCYNKPNVYSTNKQEDGLL